MTTDGERDRIALAVSSIPGIGRKRTIGILKALASRPLTSDELMQLVGSTPRLSNEVKGGLDVILEKALRDADVIIEEYDDKNISVIAYGSDRLPPAFWDIPDPPAVLYVLGSVQAVSDFPTVAVVGTRKPTAHGKKCAERFGRRFAETGITVVSGLAFGCDVAAHEGCLAAGGRTVAVLAHGLQSIHPRAHRMIAHRMVDEGGCLVSEYPVGTEVQRYYYVERDRLQSALSRAVVIVETDIEGGTMHTFQAAESQGRAVYCLAPRDQEKSCASTNGTQRLLAEAKADPLANSDDMQMLIDRVCCTNLPTDESVSRTGESGGATRQRSLFPDLED